MTPRIPIPVYDGEEGAIMSSVPAGRMAEIQAHIDLTIAGLASFGVAP
jgi:hypothetical protein